MNDNNKDAIIASLKRKINYADNYNQLQNNENYGTIDCIN